jgi:hypothetical protein
MLHLDLTPDHILLSGWDRALLLDGAWLKVLGNPFLHSAPVFNVDYAAPEVLRGQAVPASDVFALGVTMLEATTGVPAARLHNAFSNKITWEPIPHPGLNELLARMVEGSLGDRFGSAAHALQGLHAVMTGGPILAASPSGTASAAPPQTTSPLLAPSPSPQPAAQPLVQPVTPSPAQVGQPQPPAQPQAPSPQPPAPTSAPPQPQAPPKIVESIEDISTEEGLEALMALYENLNT